MKVLVHSLERVGAVEEAAIVTPVAALANRLTAAKLEHDVAGAIGVDDVEERHLQHRIGCHEVCQVRRLDHVPVRVTSEG